MKFSKIEDSGGRHHGFTKALLIFAWMKQFLQIVKCIHLTPATCLDSICQKCTFFEMQEGSGRPCYIYTNVNSFQIDVAILTTFQQHTPGSKQYGCLGSEMYLFKFKMAATAGQIQSMSFSTRSLLRSPIWRKPSTEESVILLLPFRTVAIASAYPR